MTNGTVTNFEDSATVRFERHINAPIDSVWEAITDPNHLADWLAPALIEPRVGGTVHIDFGEDQKVEGAVSVFAPPHTLEYTWTFTGEPDSVLRFSLAASEGGTLLELAHRLVPSDQAPGYGAGWHAYLDILQASIEGAAPVDWTVRFNEVFGSYAGA
jgi:uncharacterized protein YndB with AHSA1/START domain